MSEQFAIRSATNADLPAIRSVLMAVRREFGVVDQTGVSDDDLNDLESHFFGRGGVFQVVVDKRLQLHCRLRALCPLNRSRAELCKMYILKRARGKGLGKQMLENLLQAARSAGFTEVWLETNSVLTVATRLYERYGFQPVEADHLLPRATKRTYSGFLNAGAPQPGGVAPGRDGLKLVGTLCRPRRDRSPHYESIHAMSIV